MTETSAIPASPQGTIPRLLLVLILCLAALIQLTVVSKTTVEAPLRQDAGQYFSYAFNLHTYGIYSAEPSWAQPSIAAPIPDKLRTPGYPLFLAVIGKPEPTDTFLHRVSLAQAALGVLSVLLIYMIAEVFLGRPGALVVALLTTISPQLAVVSTYMLTESLFVFLLLASVLALLRAIRSPGHWPWLATGLLWGLCSLVRPTAQFFPVLMLSAVLAIPSLRQFRVQALIGFAAFALVLSPWLIRNQSEAIAEPTSSLLVNTIAHGSYPGFMYDNQPESFAYPYRYDPNIKEITADLPAILGHIAGRFRAEPFIYTRWYLIGKPAFFLSWGGVQGDDILIYSVLHSPFYENPRFAMLRSFAFSLHWPLMIVGLVGVLIALLRPRWLVLDAVARQAATVVSLVVVYAIMFHVIAAPFPRYAIPFRPFIYALALLPLRAAWLAFRPGAGRFQNPPPSGSL